MSFSHQLQAHPVDPYPVPLRMHLRSHAARMTQQLFLMLTEEMLWRMVVFYILLSVHFPA
jgi:hypothetical protein